MKDNEKSLSFRSMCCDVRWVWCGVVWCGVCEGEFLKTRKTAVRRFEVCRGWSLQL